MAITNPDRTVGVVTLDSIVRGALMDIGAGLERYEQFLHWAIKGYQKFHFDLAQEVKTVQLDLTAWKAIQWPSDYVDWVMIGVRVNGMVRVFTNDDKIALYFDDATDDGTPDVQPVTDPFTFDPTTNDPTNPFLPTTFYFWGLTPRGEDAGELYGLSVKGNGTGYYRVNPEREEIQFSPTIEPSTKIYLEYITSGYDANKATLVNVYAADLISQYMHWQRLKHSKAPRLEVKMAMDDYYAEFNRVNTRVNKITVGDVLEAARDAYKLTPSF